MNWKLIAALALFTGFSGAMHADILNYTIATTGVGSLDGTSFNFGARFYSYGVTFTMTADPANVVGQYTFSISGPVTVSIAGGGTDTLTDPFILGDDSDRSVTLEDTVTAGSIALYTRYPCLTCPPYDFLKTPYGPAYFDFFNKGQSFNTAHGTLVLGPDNPYTTTGAGYFQVSEANIASTPEPSSFILLGSGALGLLTVLRKRPRN